MSRAGSLALGSKLWQVPFPVLPSLPAAASLPETQLPPASGLASSGCVSVARVGYKVDLSQSASPNSVLISPSA